MATGSYACHCRFYFQYHRVCPCRLAVRHRTKLQYADCSGRDHADDLRLGCRPDVAPFYVTYRQVERRKLLICLFVVFIASHVLSFLAWNFTVLVISRIGIAFAHAIFWSITASLAIRLAPAGTPVFYLNGELSPKELKELGAAGLDYHMGVIKKHPEWIKEAHELGLKVNVWTVDEVEDMKSLIEQKVDFITTNEPVILQEELKKHQ